MAACLRFAASGLLVLSMAAGLAGAVRAAKPQTPARSVSGIVSQVVDGNTLRLSPTDTPTMVVRLVNIDAPELCQVGGEQARLALSEWALNRLGTLQIRGRDRDGRLLGTLVVDGIDINRHMVEEGHAWSAHGRNGHGPLLKQERVAKALARGLHARRGAVLPSEFRRLHGPCAGAGREPAG